MNSSLILCDIFSQSLQCCTIPSDWKVGRVVPLHKSGVSHSPLNYRPISLTSIPCKLMEHVIYSHVVCFLESNSFFSTCQHGFRKYLSCETQLLLFTNDLFRAVDNGFVVDCIFLDFAKAFDSVSHQLLFFKLDSLNLDANVLSWIKCFLSNRFQYVSANGHDSSFASVTSGVPQGSVLGPLLFLIYINDLPTQVSSTIKLFADDCVIYRIISNSCDRTALQTDLDSISRWCSDWLMKLNINKCKSMRVSRVPYSTNPADYTLNNTPLTAVTSYKYLGVIIAQNLSWTLHVNYIINNANRMLGFLRRNFSRANTTVKLTLYKTLVRPKLEYACSIWDPGQVTLTNSLELIQNRSARFIISNYSRYSSVSAMKLTLDLPDLALRRQCSRLCLFHKIFYFDLTLKEELLHRPSYVSSRIDHSQKVGVPLCRTKIYSDALIPRTSEDWNHLPASITAISDSKNFKTAINTYICSCPSSL